MSLRPRARGIKGTLPKASYSSTTGRIRRQLQDAIHACQEKKGEDIAVLRLGPNSAAFTDYFVLCTGTNPTLMICCWTSGNAMTLCAAA